MQKKIYKNVQGFETCLTLLCREIGVNHFIALSINAIIVFAASMTRQFVDLMTRYQDTQAQHKVLLRERVARQVNCEVFADNDPHSELGILCGLQYKVANPGAKKEEVEAFIESGAENVFADKVFSKADQVTLADQLPHHQNLTLGTVSVLGNLRSRCG